MKASEIQFNELLSQTKVSFIIPVYQRNYDWIKSQCKEFLKDIESLMHRERDNHFLGSIVYIKGDNIEAIESGRKEYIIIDGQQRITTSILFLKAIHTLSQDEWIKEEIYNHFLTNKNKGEYKLKLQLVKKDNEKLKKIIFEEPLLAIEPASKILENYHFFIEELKKSKFNIDDFLNAFKRIGIVYIELDREKDNPQLIFESINSTGLSLSEADLIRNFILMDKEHEEQKYLFENYWFKIETSLTNENISSFMRDYLIMKTTNLPNKSKVYVAFKDYLFKSKQTSEELLKDLLYYAEIYSNFLNLNYKNKEITLIIQDIKDLKKTVSYPYFLHLFNDYKQNIITDLILIKCLKLIRNYIFRRLICEYNNNIFTRLFANLHKELILIDNYNNNYYENLANILIDKRGGKIFPDNKIFKEYFLTKDIYNFTHKYYLLYTLESFKNQEVVPFDSLEIEHIMPQKLTSEWKNELGENSSKIYDNYLHTIGNLTLTGYNQKLSNSSFKDKQAILKISGIKLNSYFDNIKSWNEQSIKERAEDIFNTLALKIWDFPKIDRNLLNKQTYFDLSQNIDVTGNKIKKITILEDDLIVNSWVESYEEVCKYFYKIDQNIFLSFLEDDNFMTRDKKMIDSNNLSMRKPREINHNLYIESNLNSKTILSHIKYIANKFNYKNNDITFYIYD